MKQRFVVLLVVAFVVFSLSTRANAQATEKCIKNPSAPECANYKYPDNLIAKDLDSLCAAMFFMPGCSLRQVCANLTSAQATPATAPYCKPFSVLKDICLDMPKMSGCRNYTSMCNANATVVAQCNAAVLPDLPTAEEAGAQVTSICNEMAMEGCSQCAPGGMMGYLQCDILRTYSDLCLAMPDMSQCAQWKQMCTAIPNWPLCSTADNSWAMPPMRMYFHQSVEDIVLFYYFVPRTPGEYFGTVVLIITVGVLLEGLRAFRGWWEKQSEEKMKQELALLNNNNNNSDNNSNSNSHLMDEEVSSHQCHHHQQQQQQQQQPKKKECHKHESVTSPLVATNSSNGNSSRKLATSRRVTLFLTYDVTRSCIVFIETIISMALMLVAMTFNVGLFLAVCFAAALGNLIFGKLNSGVSKTGCH